VGLEGKEFREYEWDGRGKRGDENGRVEKGTDRAPYILKRDCISLVVMWRAV